MTHSATIVRRNGCRFILSELVGAYSTEVDVTRLVGRRALRPLRYAMVNGAYYRLTDHGPADAVRPHIASTIEELRTLAHRADGCATTHIARHDDGTRVTCDLSRGHDGAHEDHSNERNGEIIAWAPTA